MNSFKENCLKPLQPSFCCQCGKPGQYWWRWWLQNVPACTTLSTGSITVSILGVVALWGDCMDFPADQESHVLHFYTLEIHLNLFEMSNWFLKFENRIFNLKKYYPFSIKVSISGVVALWGDCDYMDFQANQSVTNRSVLLMYL